MGCGSSKGSTVEESAKSPAPQENRTKTPEPAKENNSVAKEDNSVITENAEAQQTTVTTTDETDGRKEEVVETQPETTPEVQKQNDDAECAPPPPAEKSKTPEPEATKPEEPEVTKPEEPEPEQESRKTPEPEDVKTEEETSTNPQPEPSVDQDAEPTNNGETEGEEKQEVPTDKEEEPEVPVVEPETEPASEPAPETEPASETEPAAESAPEPEPASESAVEQEPTPPAETDTTQEPDQQTGTQDVPEIAVCDEMAPTETTTTDEENPEFTEFQSAAVSAHNDCRAKHSVSELTLNKGLCAAAQSYAEQLAANGSTEQSTAESRLHGGEAVGESIVSGDAEMTGEAATMVIYNELEAYNFEKHGASAETDRFTQLVWKESQQLGVGKCTSPDGATVIIVFRYFPTGNTENGYEENVPLAL